MPSNRSLHAPLVVVRRGVRRLRIPHGRRPLRRDFLVSRTARDRYEIDEALLSVRGTAVVADLDVAQRAAERINRVRDSARYPQLGVTPGDLFAAALVHELMHLLIDIYRERFDPVVFERAETALRDRLGDDAFVATLERFVDAFPPRSVARGEQSPKEYLAGRTDGDAHREVALEELLLLFVANENPALERLHELFDDADLARESAYRALVEGLGGFFDDEPGFGGGSLLEMLLAPGRASPTSVEGQLRYIRESWAPALGERFRSALERLLLGMDVLQEERDRGGPGGAPGPSPLLGRDDLRGRGREEIEAFSSDESWMPQVVLLAKSTYVWLGQLSKRYERDVSRLDQVPDEELDEIARRGITGLWLIGLWQRSEASRRIKHLRGNPDAVASAYALYDYRIADDLGGVGGYENLRDRAWRRGIRLASDMVPNHVGIDARWVIEHPDWFLQLDHPPYPGYTFDGPDLSSDDRVGVFLEDHYYDNSDAAVVFKRLDRHSGEARYIYHGNDGTSMPWNDTAQIDYLNPEAREAVIETILHVARQFSIIRFDAAMTLAKQHIQRLWFPPPGEGGAIPSRSRYGSTSHEDFERAIPEEFWREVVDRVAEEVPGTLLLAEAFWMMEGYFVRTLGMHRVYNSAFMNMLKREENADYRQLMKNVLEFDPQILKRFVNFMNNPDEETAVAQFGKEDKYFGVATLLATLPGLPMIGHGQIEGYHEKYGMEYRRAKLDEQPDAWLIERHRREIFPLLHRRRQFAEVDEFLLYDLWADWGVNENVFAYSNRVDGERSLVIVNNSYQHASGSLRSSVAYSDKGQGGAQRQRTLAEGLALEGGGDRYLILREHVSGLEHLHRVDDLGERGLRVDVAGYGRRVFLDLEEVRDEDGSWRRLHDALGGRGVASLEEERAELVLAPLLGAFGALLEPTADRARSAAASDSSGAAAEDPTRIAPKSGGAEAEAATEAATSAGEAGPTADDAASTEPAAKRAGDGSDAALGRAYLAFLGALAAHGGLALDDAEVRAAHARYLELRDAALEPHAAPAAERSDAPPVAAALAAAALLPLAEDEAPASLLRRLRLASELRRAAERAHAPDPAGVADGTALALERLAALDDAAVPASGGAAATGASSVPDPTGAASRPAATERLLRDLRDDERARDYLRANWHDGVLWFNKERFERLARLLAELAPLATDRSAAEAEDLRVALVAAAERSGYRLERLADPPRPERDARAAIPASTATGGSADAADASAERGD